MADVVPVPSERTRRTLFLVFALSLAVRALAWVLVVTSDVKPIFDEAGYFRRAEGMLDIVRNAFSGTSSTPEEWRQAYGGGLWPPLHPLVLVPGAWLGGVTGARLVVVLVSSSTTPLVFLVTRRLTDRKAALCAALAHALYPSFVAFSHLLWSETLFIFFVFATLLGYLRLTGGGPGGEVRRALVAGTLLGLAGLTRATVMPFLVVLPIWCGWRLARRRVLLPLVSLLAAALVLSPWLVVQYRMLGQFVPISTRGGFNFYLGNNPYIEAGQDSVIASPAGKERVDQTLAREMEVRSLSPDDTATELALENIRDDPGAFVERILLRLRLLWNLDGTVVRHVFKVVYPPLPAFAVAGIVVALALGYLGLVVLAAYGFGQGALAHRWLLLVLAAACSAVPTLCFGLPRLNLPSLALLLPLAGHGLARWRTPTRGALLLALGCAALAGYVLIRGLPVLFERHASPSLVYGDLVRRVDERLGTRSLFSDSFGLRNLGDADKALNVRLLDERQWLLGQDRSRRGFSLVLPGHCEEVKIDVVSDSWESTLALRLASPPGRADIELLDSELWRIWRPSGIDDVEIRWYGGNQAPYE